MRYHCVLDTRVGFAMEEIARLVAAFRATDGNFLHLEDFQSPWIINLGGASLAMVDWESNEDSVANNIPSLKAYYSNRSNLGGCHLRMRSSHV